jgi:hypothetical protein
MSDGTIKMESVDVEGEEKSLDLSKVKGVESVGIDLEKYHKQPTEIVSAEVVQVNSKFTPLIEGTNEHKKQWVLKLSSAVLESVGEGADKVDFRASELFNLMQNEKGEIIGFPKGEKSNLGKLCKDLRINLDKIDNLQELIDAFKGKNATIKAYNKEVTTDGNTQSRTYLKFLY